MNFDETINWLYSFQKFGIKLGLERIRYISKKLENPDKKYNVIHVGGTNGKGSVCRFIESILSQSGYKVGIYTSPHLQHISERIMVNQKKISEKEFVSLANEVKPIIKKMVREKNIPTFFEIITAMAFQFFNNNNVDFAIIEVGLGGRYDATNIVSPMITIITNVSLEHQNILGKNISNIAYEKAGIIKNDIPVITGAKGVSLKTIENVANDLNSPIFWIDNNKWKRKKCSQKYQEFYIKGSQKEYSVRTQILGEHQGQNIALSIYAIEWLQINGINISESDILNGIKKTLNPGRMEVVGYKPTIIIDGAHNKAGIESLFKSIKNDFNYDKLIVVFGVLFDKDIKSIITVISQYADVIITTKPKNKRACDPSYLKEMIIKFDKEKIVNVKDRIKDAIDYAYSISTSYDLICITGSLYTVGESRKNFLA